MPFFDNYPARGNACFFFTFCLVSFTIGEPSMCGKLLFLPAVEIYVFDSALAQADDWTFLIGSNVAVHLDF